MAKESIVEIVKRIRKHDIEFSNFSMSFEADFALSEDNAVKLLAGFIDSYAKNPGNIEQQLQPENCQRVCQRKECVYNANGLCGFHGDCTRAISG